MHPGTVAPGPSPAVPVRRAGDGTGPRKAFVAGSPATATKPPPTVIVRPPTPLTSTFTSMARMEKPEMTSRPDSRKGRSLLRLAVAGAVAVSAPVAFAGTANAAPDSTWDRLAKCESGGRWNVNTGNGYYGGLQFSPRTWRAFGGKGSAHTASRKEQIRVAERVLAAQGWKAWPSCSKKIGLRKSG